MSSKSTGLSVETVRVIVFKDGYCMFVKKAKGRVDSTNRAIINNVPESMVLGSFWAIPVNGNLANIIAKQQIITRKAKQEKEKCLLLKFNADMSDKDVEVVLNYFGPGIRWIPTYRITLENDEQCHLMMQAVVLNEAEDLDDIPMDLVVGVPNFRFKQIISPMSLEATLRNPLQQIAPQLESQTLGNVVMTQRMGYMPESGPAIGGTPSTVPALPSELSGEGSQDLFLYKIPKISLFVGERAVIPLVSTKQSFQHLYTWEVHLSRSSVDLMPGSVSISPIKLTRNEIWHQIELTNQTEVPWTTGAALIMEKLLPVAQELLTYTPIGGIVRIPLSVAIDIRGNYFEEELTREPKAIHFDRDDYAKITKKGTLNVINYKDKTIDLIIKCEFGGNANQASHDGKIKISDFQNDDWTDFRGARALTGHSSIQWKLQFAPKEKREVTFKYHYYIR